MVRTTAAPILRVRNFQRKRLDPQINGSDGHVEIFMAAPSPIWRCKITTVMSPRYDHSQYQRLVWRASEGI